MVAIYGENGTPKEQHNCASCDKIPAAITIIQSKDRKEYTGQLSLNHAIFGYKLRLVGDKLPETIEEAKNSMEFSFTDSDAKEMKINGPIRSYILTLVTGAAACIILQAEQIGIRQISGMLEQMLGPEFPAPEVSASYAACQNATPEIKQFIEDYKIRGQRA